MNNLDWLSDALGDFEDDYVRLRFPIPHHQTVPTYYVLVFHLVVDHRLSRSN